VVFELMSEVLNGLQKWCKGNSILIVSIAGTLLRLYCPFTVECTQDVEMLRSGMKYRVERVFLSKDYLLSYEIQGEVYHFKHFIVLGK
jgi:hypothetical protein